MVRTGYAAMTYFLWVNGWKLDADQNEKYDFVINIASGKSSFDEIVDWIKTHIKSTNF
jgi:death on curing protein